ncbi:MAG: class I SAM-dependent methyltransferase, partial [Candidatus Omnitrophica bacterium]|nr:class I SAM-dependent methyltransferase [Candidatus Omnitrophota bacterium]
MDNKDSLIYRLYRTKLIGALLHSHLHFLKKELKGCASALDIGCGADSPMQYIRIPHSVGVDIYGPAVEESRSKKIHDEYIVADVNGLDFAPDSFEAVVMCETLEHLEKEAGRSLLDRAERWAKKKVLVSCPNGYILQEALYGNPYQVHRSGWSIKDMKERGYKPYGMVGLKWKPSRSLFFPLFFWALLSVVMQPVTYYFPSVAFEIF